MDHRRECSLHVHGLDDNHRPLQVWRIGWARYARPRIFWFIEEQDFRLFTHLLYSSSGRFCDPRRDTKPPSSG